MVCVETANAMDDAVTLAPGATHVMTATLEVLAGLSPACRPRGQGAAVTTRSGHARAIAS